MDSPDWFFETFGWIFTLTPMGWVGLLVAILVARIVLRFLWYLFFPESFRAHRERRRIARAEQESDF